MTIRCQGISSHGIDLIISDDIIWTRLIWELVHKKFKFFNSGLFSGRVCVPMDVETIESFDPFAVPTIRYVVLGN